MDSDDMYDVAEQLPELGQPVLIQALTGFVDAGHATRLAGDHLIGSLPSQVIVTFNIDELLDYRSRRPPMIFSGGWEHYDEPSLALHVVHDRGGVPFLLLRGPEPDLRWRSFTAAIQELVERLRVRLTIGLNTIPMAVPHTRPGGLTAYGTRDELIAGYEPWTQRVQVPGSAGHLLEYELGRAGKDVIGFAVHVPHYLAQTEYPAAAEQLLVSVSRATGLLLPVDELRAAAAQVRIDLDKQIARDNDASALVRALEQQYDAYVRGREGASLLAEQPTGPLPNADELGAAFERFLAEQDNGEDQRGT